MMLFWVAVLAISGMAIYSSKTLGASVSQKGSLQNQISDTQNIQPNQVLDNGSVSTQTISNTSSSTHYSIKRTGGMDDDGKFEDD